MENVFREKCPRQEATICKNGGQPANKGIDSHSHRLLWTPSLMLNRAKSPGVQSQNSAALKQPKGRSKMVIAPLLLFIVSKICYAEVYSGFLPSTPTVVASDVGLTLQSVTVSTESSVAGSWVQSLNNYMMCRSTNDPYTSSSRNFLFSWFETGFSKTVNVHLSVVRGVLYANIARASYIAGSYYSTCDEANTVDESGSSAPLAFAFSDAGYGLYDLTFSVQDVIPESLGDSLQYSVENTMAFAALSSTGEVFTWGGAQWGGDSSSVSSSLTDVADVVSARDAFAALTNTGGIVAWGGADAISGWSAFSTSTDITSLVATEEAFAGLTDAGGVVAFGNPSYGGSTTDVASQLASGVFGVVANAAAFAAWKSDGTVVAWGSEFTGGGVSSASLSSLQDVVQVFSSRAAFAALLLDGSVVTWGPSSAGGGVSLGSVAHIVGGQSVFVAVKYDLSTFTWGSALFGGNSVSVAGDVLANEQIYLTDEAVAVRKSDGSVVAWGSSSGGGSTSAVSAQLVGITDICANKLAFAALDGSGAVIAWGDSSAGGSLDGDTALLLSSGVSSIHATNRAFAALKDGSVVAWGSSSYGGSIPSQLTTALSSGVVKLCGGALSFLAVKSDGTVVGWGHPRSVGSEGFTVVDSKYASISSC